MSLFIHTALLFVPLGFEPRKIVSSDELLPPRNIVVTFTRSDNLVDEQPSSLSKEEMFPEMYDMLYDEQFDEMVQEETFCPTPEAVEE